MTTTMARTRSAKEFQQFMLEYYRDALFQQQQENIALVVENSHLKCKVKELKAGIDIDCPELNLEFTAVNFSEGRGDEISH